MPLLARERLFSLELFCQANLQNCAMSEFPEYQLPYFSTTSYTSHLTSLHSPAEKKHAASSQPRNILQPQLVPHLLHHPQKPNLDLTSHPLIHTPPPFSLPILPPLPTPLSPLTPSPEEGYTPPPIFPHHRKTKKNVAPPSAWPSFPDRGFGRGNGSQLNGKRSWSASSAASEKGGGGKGGQV